MKFEIRLYDVKWHKCLNKLPNAYVKRRRRRGAVVKGVEQISTNFQVNI